MKPFALSGLKPREKVLSRSDFRFFCGEEEHRYDPIKMEKVVKKAEEYKDKELTVLKISDYKKYLTEGSTTAYGGPFYDRLLAMYHLGFAESYEKKGRFIEKLCDVIWAILEESSWMTPEHSHVRPINVKVNTPPASLDGEYMHGLELASLYRAAALAVIYHINKEAIDEYSEIIGERIMYALRERVIIPYLNCTFHWTGELGNKVNNWCPWCVESVLTVAALTVDSLEERKRIVERAMNQIDNFINGYGDDGGCDEGPTYWGVATGCLFDALQLLYDMTGGYLNIYDTPIIRAMGEYIARFNISGRYFVNFADSGPTVDPDGDMIKKMGEKCGSEILKSFGDYLLSTGSEAVNVKKAYRALCSFTTPSVSQNVTKRKAATDSYFRDIQVMLLRDSEDPDEGMFFAIKAGHNAESHNHNDVGSFVVYKNAKPVLIDAGVGRYTKDTFSSRRYTIWSMQSNYHSVATFDGIGQHQGRNFASSDVEYNEAERRLSMELAGTYTEDAGVKSYRRSGSLKNGTVTIEDSIETSGEREIDFIFMTHARPVYYAPGEIGLAEGCFLRFDPSLSPDLEEFEPVGINTGSTFGTDTLWRIHLRKTTDKCKYRFTIS